MHRLIAAIKSASLRRVLAAICALSFLLAGIVHTTHHFGGPVFPVAFQVESSTGDGPETPIDTTGAIEYCHACVAVALLSNGPVIRSVPTKSDAPSAPLPSIQPHLPPAETPPPIATI